MKKLLIIIFTLIFSIALGIFVFFEFKDKELKKNNKYLESEIESITNNTSNIKEENNIYEEKINDIKKEKENILKEEEIWKETKEKLVKALS